MPILLALQAGGTLVMAPCLSSTRYLGWIKEQRAEWCQFPVLMARQPAGPGDCDNALKNVAVFGWDGATARTFRDRFGVTPREGYGMTEIGLGTWNPPPLDSLFDEGCVGIDAPFRQTTIRDKFGQPAAPGENGELWIRGPGLFQGYWNMPAATAKAFVAPEDGGLNWFRTGDLFRADENGRLWLVGRVKDMIRRSGENIAAREVESVISNLRWVEDAAALPIKDYVRGEEVAVVLKVGPDAPGADRWVEVLLSYARQHLAPFKVPRYLAIVSEFPRTASNKIKKNALRDLIETRKKLASIVHNSVESPWKEKGRFFWLLLAKAF